MPTPPPSWAAKIWQILANLASQSKEQTEALDKIRNALGLRTTADETDTKSKSKETTATTAKPTPAKPAPAPVCGAKPAEIEKIQNDISEILKRLNQFDDELSKYRARFLVALWFNLILPFLALVVGVIVLLRLL